MGVTTITTVAMAEAAVVERNSRLVE